MPLKLESTEPLSYPSPPASQSLEDGVSINGSQSLAVFTHALPLLPELLFAPFLSDIGTIRLVVHDTNLPVSELAVDFERLLGRSVPGELFRLLQAFPYHLIPEFAVS